MPRLTCVAALLTLMSGPALADSLGIDFKAMPVGTQLVTETRDGDPRRYSETYLGKEGGFHVIEVAKVKDGEILPLLKQFFDAEGRKVRSEKKGKFTNSSTPFSCEYVTGPCKHTYVYANPFKNGKLVTHDEEYANRFEGSTLVVSLARRGQSALEIPYELGRYNLRVSSEYTNALGQVRGYKLIEIIEP